MDSDNDDLFVVIFYFYFYFYRRGRDRLSQILLLLSSFRHHCGIINASNSKSTQAPKMNLVISFLNPHFRNLQKCRYQVLGCSRHRKELLSLYISTAAHIQTMTVLMGPKGISNRNAAFFVCF